MSKYYVFIGVLGASIIAAYFLALPISSPVQPKNSTISPSRTITIGEAPVHVFVADTSILRSSGLSGYSPLLADEGMLFVFPADGLHTFWMKDMLFSIDMIWISSDFKVVHLEKNVSPASYPKTFSSRVPARYVLEVAAGFSDTHLIEEGSHVSW